VRDLSVLVALTSKEGTQSVYQNPALEKPEFAKESLLYKLPAELADQQAAHDYANHLEAMDLAIEGTKLKAEGILKALEERNSHFNELLSLRRKGWKLTPLRQDCLMSAVDLSGKAVS
jgi:hypothetical protein